MYCVCRPQPVKASGAAAASHPDSSEQAGFRPVGASLAPDGTPIMPVSGLHARHLQTAQAVQPQAVGLEAWVLCVIGNGRTLPNFIPCYRNGVAAPRALLLLDGAMSRQSPCRAHPRHLRRAADPPDGPQYAEQLLRRHGHHVWSTVSPVSAARHQRGRRPGETAPGPEVVPWYMNYPELLLTCLITSSTRGICPWQPSRPPSEAASSTV